MNTFSPTSIASAILPTLLVWIPLSSIANEPAADADQSGVKAVAAYERPISAQAEHVKMAMINQLGAERYWQEVVEELTLTDEQQAELRALQMLADDRFTPHLADADLADSIQAVLRSEDQERLAARLPAPGQETAAADR